MFDQLSERLQSTLSDVRGRGKLTEADIDKAMREIRLALLEADVNFKVVKSFTATVKERCYGSDVLGSLNPGQQVVKIVNEELTELMGGAGRDLAFSSKGTTVIMMAGLQGSGKTTASANSVGSNGRRSSIFSPTPMSFTGIWSSVAIARVMPPLAVPSSLVSTTPSTSVASAKAFA